MSVPPLALAATTRRPTPLLRAALALAATLAVGACDPTPTAPRDGPRPGLTPRAAITVGGLTIYDARADWEAAVAAAGSSAQAFDFTGLAPARISTTDTDYGVFRIVVDQVASSPFSNPGCGVVPDGPCNQLVFNVVDPATPFASIDGPRVNQLVMDQPISAFGADFLQVGIAPASGLTGTVTLQFGAETLVLNDHVDAAGNGFVGIIAATPATTLTFRYTKAAASTIWNDIFQALSPAYATGGGPTPVQRVDALRATLATFALPAGTARSLDTKLRAASAALAANDQATACRALQDLLDQVASLAGKRLTEADAALLTTTATAIRTALGC